ncbi:hypothetical protein PUN4_1570005 [Paraburkholderia unamae]|nr:hypothetical protein PUN4_1570005 [Paraburkholderia unamae]
MICLLYPLLCLQSFVYQQDAVRLDEPRVPEGTRGEHHVFLRPVAPANHSDAGIVVARRAAR